MNIPLQRTHAQGLYNPVSNDIAHIVGHLGAMQAQDYAGALWSIGARMKHPSLAAVEAAIVQKQIVRTWPMRGTLHFVAAKDIRWMLSLLGPRATASAEGRRRGLGITDSVMSAARRILETQLRDGTAHTRSDLCKLFATHGIASDGQRGIHILRNYCEQGVICQGPQSGKEPTFVLLDAWLPMTDPKTKDEALADLATRYFTSHGPATLRDFVGWGYMTMSDARRGLAAASVVLQEQIISGVTYYYGQEQKYDMPSANLLPGFDEYILGYKDRSAVLALEHSQKIVPGNNGMFMPTIIIDGQVRGTWKRVVRKTRIDVFLEPFTTLDPSERELLTLAAQRYAAFLGLPVTLI